MQEYYCYSGKVQDLQQRIEEVRKRAKLLEDKEKVPPPPGGLQDPDKVAAWIRGSLAEKSEDALRIYSHALPDLGAVSREDTALLVARATCRIAVANSATAAPNATAETISQATQDCENALSDATAASRFAFYRNEKVFALEQVFYAHILLYRTATSPGRRSEMYKLCTKDVAALQDLAPRRPNEWLWYGAFVQNVLAAEIRKHAGNVPQHLQDYSNLIEWARRTVDSCKLPRRRESVRTHLLKDCTRWALKFAEVQLASTPPLNPPLRTDLEKKRDEWKHLLDTLP
jgi:hypothetical protein